MKTKFSLFAIAALLIVTPSLAQKKSAPAHKPAATAAPAPVSDLHEVGNATTGAGVVFVGNWSAFNKEPVTFQKDKMNYLHIDGKVVIGSGSTVFILPVDCRPKVARTFLLPKQSGLVPPSYVRCKINVDGSVQIGNGDATQSGEVISLDGISVALF